MTNETTASQPCPTCGGSKVDPGGLPVCRTCSASQPKSIGDDAQFRALMINVIEANSENYEAYDFCSSKLYAYLDSKLRAPAAQASATIQAAPVGWEPVYMTWNDTIMAWVDVGLAEYEAAEPEERRTTYQPAEVN